MRQLWAIFLIIAFHGFSFRLSNVALPHWLMSSGRFVRIGISFDVLFFMAFSFSRLVYVFALCPNNRLLIAVRQTRKSVL